jgi:diguanylate cyclase (GGDEF)-like protein
MAPRYGGEEFALILPETSSEDAVSLAERLRKSIYDLSLEHKIVLVNLGEQSLWG